MVTSRSNWTGIAFGLGLSYLAAYHLFKLPPVLPRLLDAYHYDRLLAGAFMSVNAAVGLCLSLPVSRSLARGGAFGAILGALIALIAGSALALAIPENGWVMLAGRAAEGVGFAVLAISGPLLANACAAPRHLPIIAGMAASWIPVGQIAATLLTFVGQGWRMLWAAGIIAGLGFILLTLRLRARGTVDFSLGAKRAATRAPADRSAAPGIRRLSLVLAATIFALWVGQYFAYMTWLPQYLVDVHGLTASTAVVGYAVPVVILIVANQAAGALLRAGAPFGPLFALGLAVQTAVWWTIPAIGSDAGGLVSLIAYGIAAGVCTTCVFALPGVLAGQGPGAASAFGVLMTGRNLGVLIGPVLLAQAFEITNAWDIAVPIFGTVTSLALGLGLWLAVILGGAR